MMSFGKLGKENGVFPWAKTYDEDKEIFKKNIELGINYFDTANVYQMGSSEEITGHYIKDFGLVMKLSLQRRLILKCARVIRMVAALREKML